MHLEQPNLTKLEELEHYIIHKCQDKPTFGKVVLYKLLYFSDFNFYKKNYTAITNEQYRKIQNGPAPVHFDVTLEKLVEEEKVSTYTKEFSPAMEQQRFKSLKKPTLEFLSKNELKEVDLVIKKLGDFNARQMSSISHEDNPWKATKLKDIIDYGLVFYRNEKVSKVVE